MRRDFKGGRANEWTEKRQRVEGGWASAPTSNDAFIEYYQAQGICPAEEWETFMETLNRPLPMTFRINGSGKFAQELRERLANDFLSAFGEGQSLLVDGEEVAAPRALEWYPERLAWQFEFSRTQLRRHPALSRLHDFIKRENEVGGITRQEAVSMVPPLFLDVQPSHRVLDLCAAPGSKTAQLLEHLHRGEGVPEGLVLANDADARRCNLLAHQTARLASPALLITNHEAQKYPRVHEPLAPGEEPAVEGRLTKAYQFDRILCDVPCSGDGTLRKAPDIWRRWTPGNGNGLHPLQLCIALRAVELLKTGGLLVYSTCSLNPVENESVVAEVLRRTAGCMELVDTAGQLPELVRLPGLSGWKVRDRERWHRSWEASGRWGIKLDPTMFPQGGSAEAEEGGAKKPRPEELESVSADAEPLQAAPELRLERCMRFLPHAQDTGGFFVAVLRKIAPLDRVSYPSFDHRKKRGRRGEDEAKEKAGGDDVEEKDEADEADENADEAEAEEAEKKENDKEAGDDAAKDSEDYVFVEAEAGKEEEPAAPRTNPAREQLRRGELPDWAPRGGGSRNRPGGGGRWRGIDPIIPYTDASQCAAMEAFYGLRAGESLLDSLIARSAEATPKRLNLVSSGVKHLLRCDVSESLKITAAGVKLFERQTSRDGLVQCAYRLSQEGLPAVLNLVGAQRFELGLGDLLELLQRRSVSLPESVKMHISRVQKLVKGMAGAEGEEPEGEAAAGEQAASEAGLDGDAEPDAPKVAPHMLEDQATLAALESISYGCCVCTLRVVDGEPLGFTRDRPLAITCWRGRGTLTVLVSKQECAQTLDRIRVAQEEIALANAEA
ncbi:hypothetical protein H632_c429p1 [Helicosporidium sp. ATCC 50920]|nr:hypothetical protein H632_c429p1 [Helicosporidium sp. ATCC 50920]|eukprot:KDD75934.1 hypothetical protein H632_c429p1 [Helicosporidium sp. ATCC 50920]